VEVEHVAREHDGSVSVERTVPEPPPDPPPAAQQGRRPSLASLLTGAGIATYEQISAAVAEGTATGEKLGEVVVRHGWVTEDGLAALLAEQWQLPYLHESRLKIDPGAVARMPRETARTLGAAPLWFHGAAIVVAVADPSAERFDAVRAELGQVSFVVVGRSVLERLHAGTLPGPERAAVLDGVEQTSALLSAVQDELTRLAGALREAERRLGERDEELSALRLRQDRDAQTIRRLEEALATREDTISLLRAKLADMLRTLDG
jgi:hypothetical protein